MSRLTEFVIKRDFGRETYGFTKTLMKISNHKVIGRSKGYGDVRLTMNGVGAISNFKIDKKLKGNLDFIAIGTLEAINDARHKVIILFPLYIAFIHYFDEREKKKIQKKKNPIPNPISFFFVCVFFSLQQ